MSQQARGTPGRGVGLLSSSALYLTSGGAVVLGGLIALVVSVGSGGGWGDGARWTMYMLAAAAVAVILGLIFGVPRARADFNAEATERYSSNSNLEQISDWLTKLLVGAGLVEIKSIPGWAADAGGYLGAGMAVPNAAAFSVAALVYGAGVGFTSAYLWTRLRLRFLLESSDRIAAEASRQRDQIVLALSRANAPSEEPESSTDLRKAAESAISSMKAADRKGISPILWVDDYPSNNTSIVEALASLSIRVDLALSTKEALERLRLRRYGLIISDLGRTEDGQENDTAGLDLIRAVRETDTVTPIFIYAGPRGTAMRAELEAAGATLVTARPSTVFEQAVEAVTSV